MTAALMPHVKKQVTLCKSYWIAGTSTGTLQLMGCVIYSVLLGTLQNAGSSFCSLACLYITAQQRFSVIQVTLPVTVLLLLLHAAL